MKAQKQIITHEPMDITIDKITLLSIEEYKRCRERISIIDCWWWLRSPSYYSYYAKSGTPGGNIDSLGNFVNFDNRGVRPVVVLRLNPESPNPQIGDRLEFAGHTWTVIDDDMALCDGPAGYTCFRRNWQAPDANDYEKSDVKKWLENWAMENGIEVSST